MPKAAVGTPKWVANKMKSKGLQKLKWYCQMCEKQCRDENGFKCHRLSESHQRQMQVFCSNAHRFMDNFSRQFEHSFMQLMRTRYCRTRVLANTVYQEVISDKHHIHMNATVWVTLSEFVLYLGRQGKCKVEHTPKGWYLEYIDQEKLKREDEEERRKIQLSLEQRHQMLINKLIQDSKANGGFKEPEYTNLQKGDENIVIQIKPKEDELPSGIAPATSLFEDEPAAAKRRDSSSTEPKSVLEKMASKSKRAKGQGEYKDDVILRSGIIVKAMSNDKNHGKKCLIAEIDSGSNTAILEAGGDRFTLPIKSLRTVIPAIGGKVRILAGEWSGKIGILKSIDVDNYSASIEVIDSTSPTIDLPYEHFSKTSS